MSPRYTALFALLFVAACASPPAPTDGAPDTSVTDTAASDAAPNTDADVDADIDVDADNADAEDDDIDANDGLPNAAPCVEDAECASELCLDLQHHDAFCAQYCVADECTDGQSCQVYTPSAGSQPFGVCLEITACFDADGDGFGIGAACLGGDCDEADPGVNWGSLERCNGIDDDCDAAIDEDTIDSGVDCDTGMPGLCAAGVVSCDHGELRCLPAASATDEVCNGLDDDCDLAIDDDPVDGDTYFRDTDGDGHGDAAYALRACEPPPGYVVLNDDCDDSDAYVHGGASERCDGLDDDCDGIIDDDCTCETGQRLCGDTCIAEAACCDDSDCVGGATCDAPGSTCVCAPNADRRCVDGHPTWIDACGAAGEPADTCETREICEAGACVPDPCEALLATDEVTRVTLPRDIPTGSSARHAWHDAALFAASVQGIVNREGPRVFLNATRHDDVWWPLMSAPGQRLGGTAVTDVAVDALYERFACRLDGVVLWDPNVPATVNVATTVAGVEDLAILRYDPAPDSLYTAIMAGPQAPEIVVDLRDRFTGTGTIWETGEPSSGSAKNDAYRWMIAQYVESGRAAWNRSAYLIDSWWIDHDPASSDVVQTHNRDYFITHRAPVFDLSSWGDEVPVDDPGQPLGTDQATLHRLLRAMYDQHGGAGFSQLSGFTPWAWKYTSFGSAGGRHAEVETEWDLVRQLTAFNVTLDADALAFSTLANASLYQYAELADRRVPPPAPTPQRLRDLGAWDNWLVNPGFDDNGHVGGWDVSLTSYLTETRSADAYAGVNVLHAGPRGDSPPNSVAQDVAISLAPGETVRAAVYVRGLTGGGNVSLAVWGLNGPENGTAAQHITPADGWVRVETAYTATQAQDRVRFELYLPVGELDVLVDAASLWVDGRETGVTDHQFAVWHMADYDAGSGLYQFFPGYWDDPARGQLPLAWGLNPNLIDRFPLAFDHAWGTATSHDHFAGADTFAGYVNLTQLYGERSPSGLPDATSAFEVFARPYLQRAQLSDTVFALNGSAGPYDATAHTLMQRLGSRGVGYHMAGQTDRGPFEVAGTPFIGTSTDFVRGDTDASVGRVLSVTGGGGLGFHIFRIVFDTPSRVRDVNETVVRDHPSHRLVAVSPAELFTLVGLTLGQRPSHRVTWVSDTLPTTVVPSATVTAEVTVRNDGWDTWRAGGGWRLGIHVAAGDRPEVIPPRTAGAGYPHRFALPRDVGPGESVTLTVSFPAPSEAGPHTVQLDMVEEGVTWFESGGEIPWRTVLHVTH